MRYVVLLIFMLFGTVASADLLSESRGQWEGSGTLESGFEFPIYVKFLPRNAEVYTPEDGCRANWTFERVLPDMIKGWEELTEGYDRCYVGLEFVVTRYDENRLQVDWFQSNGMFVAKAILWRVQ